MKPKIPWIDPTKRTQDEQLVHDYYYDTLKWCGCGNPDEALGFLRDVLKLLKVRSHESREGLDTWAQRTAELNKLLAAEDHYLLGLSYMYLLDSLGLTEHGGNVCGCWLDEKGYELLDLLERTDLERALDCNLS